MSLRRIISAAAVLCVLFCAPTAHAQKTKAQLNTEITTNFPDNSVGAITPSILRTTTSDILNSIMPTAPVGSGNLACFSGTTGLLQDCGTLPPLTGGTTTTVLHGNASGQPSYGAVNLTTDVSNQLPIGSGGTGQATASTARGSSGLNIYGDAGTGHGDTAVVIGNSERFSYTTATFTASRTWTLPAANVTAAPYTVKIADLFGGVTNTNTLVIARAGGDTINGGGTSVTISAANGGYECSSDGSSKWSCLSMGSASAGGVTSVSAGSGTAVAPTTGSVTVAALPQNIPGGRLNLQMSNTLGGGVPSNDVIAASSKVIIISCGTTTWTVPLDFTSTNSLEAFGAGGGGGGALAAGSTGGGGGGYSKTTNVSTATLVPGSTVTVAVACGGAAGAASGGSGGSATPTFLCFDLTTNCASIAGTAVLVGANGGAGGVPPGGSAALGGSTTGAIGSTKFAGGNSGIGGGTSSGGAGGSAGPSGAGGTGANGSGSTGGAGGTANNGSVAGGAANSNGVASATIETETLTGKVVTVASGAGGSSASGSAGACPAGSFGGGGGGGAATNGAGAAGCPGGLVVTYTAAPTTILYSPCSGYVTACGGPFVPLYNGTNMTLQQFTASLGDTTGLSLLLSTGNNVSGNCYDIFVGLNSSVLTLGTGPAWSSCTAGSSTRGTGAGTTQLAMAGGVQVNAQTITINNGATSFSCPQFQCTALGSIHVSSAVNGQVSLQYQAPAMTGGPNAEVGLYNFYNRYPLRIRGQDSTSSWTYNVATARSANNSNNNRLTVLDGLGAEQMRFFYMPSVTGPGAFAGTPELTLNQACSAGITGGGGQGALVSQPAGNTNADGGVGPAFYSTHGLLGETFMQACDGATNASLTVFGLDFGQYWIDYNQ